MLKIRKIIKKIISIVAYQLYTFLFNILILSQKIPNKYKRNGPITFVFQLGRFLKLSFYDDL